MTCNIINFIKSKVKEIFQKLISNEPRSPKNTEQLLSELSPSIDDIIINHVKNQHYKYVGGEIQLSVTENRELSILWDLYFLDNNEKYHKVSSKKIIDKSIITEPSFEQIKKDKPKFVIEPPKL